MKEKIESKKHIILGLTMIALLTSFIVSFCQVKAENNLFYCTFFGGSQNDVIRDLKIDSQGSIIIVGGTYSKNFPIKNAVQEQYGGGGLPPPDEYFPLSGDCIIAKFSSNYQLEWSTYLGGKSHEYAFNLQLDSDDNIIVFGTTTSSDFPITDGSTLSGKSGGDYFITRFDPDGKLLSSIFYAANEINSIITVGKTPFGEFILVGSTSSTNFYCSENAIQKELRGQMDGYIRTLSGDLKTVVYSTYLGGGSNDSIGELTISPDGSIFVSGGTMSLDFPVTENCIQSKFGGGDRDAFIACIDSNKHLVMSTYLGGSDIETIFGISQTSEFVLVVGFTRSSNFPTTSNAYQPKYSETEFDGFVSQISIQGDELIYSTFYGLKGWDCLLQVNIDDQGKAIITGYVDSSGFETIKPFQSEYMGYTEIIVIIVGEEIELISYLGGYDMDHPMVQVLDNGRIYLAGFTGSAQFPVTDNPYQKNIAGGEDGFLWAMDYRMYLSGEMPETQGSDLLSPVYRLYLSYAAVFGGIALWFLYVKRSFKAAA